ncbi:MAG: hypothetical protein JWO17_953 [Actinomycetia bacterium]|nr:hypothetical protein [Actinomycetes bacterium]
MRKLGALAFAVAFAAAAFVVIEGAASSASDAPLWRWQGAIAGGRATELAATTSGVDQIALVAVRDASNQPTLIVRANGQDVQKAPASGIASGSPLAAFVVGDSAGTQAILGLAREDAAHVFLITSGATAQELPLNGSGAFAASGVAPSADAELEAVGSDGATLARLVLPSAGGFCGGPLSVCSGFQGSGMPRGAAARVTAAPLLYAIREHRSKGLVRDELTRLDPTMLKPRGAPLQLGFGKATAGVGVIALSPDQSRIAVAPVHGGTLRVVDLASLRITSTIPTRAGVDVRAMAWLDNDQIALIEQQMGAPYQRNVVGRWLIRAHVARGTAVAMSLPKNAMLRYTARAGSRFVAVLQPNNFRDPKRTVVVVEADGRMLRESVSLPPPSPTSVEDAPVLSVDGSHLYFVRVGGQVIDLDLSTQAQPATHQMRAPSDAPGRLPESSVVRADATPTGLVVSGVFTLARDGHHVFRTGVYRVDTSNWSATTLDTSVNNYLVYGDKIATFGTAPPFASINTATPGAGVTAYSATSGRRLYHLFDKQRFSQLRLVGSDGHAFRLKIRPGTPYGLVDSHFNATSGVGTGVSRPPLNGLRLIYRGSPDIQEPGASAATALRPKPRRVKSSIANTQTQSSRSANRYTIANRGRLVPGHGNKIFEGHPYRLFLLGTVEGRAFYRIQLTPHYTCWGSGPADKAGTFGTSGCPAVVGAYPLQLDDNVVELKPGARTPQSLRVAGIVADQAASVALRDGNGKTLVTVPVVNNLFAFTPPFPRGFLRPVPLDANGKPLPPHPEWGQHQTPPPNLFGPQTQQATASQLGAVVQHGEARGAKVSVDQNGVVVFDVRGIDSQARRALTETKAWFACVQLSGRNVRHNRSAGISTAVAPEVAFRMVGIKPQYDGCEAGGSYGHRWHDQHGPHSTIEIAFTPQGRRYFEDRATARDLAAFVRSAKTQSIRRKTGASLVAAIRKAYGPEVHILTSATARAAPGQVGIWNRGTRTIFSEVSHLGDRLYVEFSNGKLIKQNVRGLAFVF